MRAKPTVDQIKVIDILDALAYLESAGIYPNARQEWEDSRESWQLETMNSDSYHRIYPGDEKHPVIAALVEEFNLGGVGAYYHFLAHHSY